MDEQIMQLWSISSISHGKRHAAIVQEVSMQAAIIRYCGMFPGVSDNMVTIEGRALQLNRYDNFGKLLAGIAAIPS